MPKASSTVSSWVQDSFLKNKISIKTVLNNAVSSIHLSFDLWTSPNNMSLLAIVGYWSNEERNFVSWAIGSPSTFRRS